MSLSIRSQFNAFTKEHNFLFKVIALSEPENVRAPPRFEVIRKLACRVPEGKEDDKAK